jgi:ribosome biogenesis GTPase
MQSVDALNRNSLDRYLVMLNESGIQPIIVASKTDLLSESEAAEMQCRIDGLNTKHVFISALSDQGIEALSRVLEPRKTYCLLGPSGVGKTTLLNRLIGEDLLPVNEVRQSDGRGRHTTVRRQLVRLESGSIFIDTPGMRELGNFDVAAGIEQTFEDISRYAGNCRFRDCTHVHEKGCAVIDAVDRGEIAAERYRNFLKLKKEAAFYEMSYAQRRKKDRAFGKMIKSYKRMKRKPD